MPENVVERVVVPRNPPAASVLNKEKFNLFAPMARTNSPGLAAYNPDDFVINDQIVSLNPVILQDIEESKEDIELLVNELNDLFARYDVTLEALNKAITDGLALMDALKLDKSTNASSVYATDENGAQTLLKYAVGILGYGLVQRTSGGDILVRDTPASISAAVNRKYVDDKLVEKVDKITKTWQAYTTDSNGNTVPKKLADNPAAGGVVLYNEGGIVKTNTPAEDNDAANMEYVDTHAPAKIAVSMITEGEGEGEEKKEYVLRFSLVNLKGDVIPESETSIDLPLEMAFVGARLEDGNLVFTLQNGQEVSVPIGDVLGGLVTSGALAQSLSGNEEDKAPSVKAVNDGLAGKVGKRLHNAERDYAYITKKKNGGDSLAEISREPRKFAIPAYGVSTDGNTGGDGYLSTEDPVNPYHTANKKWTEEMLAGKFSLPSNLGAWSLLGIGNYNAETGEYTPQRFTTNGVGTGNAFVAAFASVSDARVFDRTDDNFVKVLKYTLGVPDPLYPIQVANKRYVDRKCRDLQQGVYNALGVQYITVEDTSDSLPPSVPPNAMRFACIESVGNAVACAEDGTEIGSVDVRVTANYIPVDTTNLPVYVDMGDSLLLHYEVDYAPDGTFYVKVTGRKIIYQVEVGA